MRRILEYQAAKEIAAELLKGKTDGEKFQNSNWRRIIPHKKNPITFIAGLPDRGFSATDDCPDLYFLFSFLQQLNNNCARGQGMNPRCKETGLSRDSLYKSFRAGSIETLSFLYQSEKSHQ